METINSVASAAAKAVWGDNSTTTTKEPVSGATGDVAKGEPYDAGNLAEPEQQDKVASQLADSVPPTPQTEATPPSQPQSDTTPQQAPPPKGDSTHDQITIKDPKDVDADKDAEKDTVPQDQLKGPGPKPVATVAKEHGGDAGKGEEAIAEGSGKPAATATDGNDAEKKEASAAAGTGEEYVKSSGLKADGGDFDASKPGAGREADRLMETKGMVPSDSKPEPVRSSEQSSKPAVSDDASNSSPSTSSKKKRMSLGARIKAKLHRD